VFKETTTGGYNVGLGYNPFSENIIGTNIWNWFWAGVIVLAVIIHFRRPDKNE
jgi:hypothetical protein